MRRLHHLCFMCVCVGSISYPAQQSPVHLVCTDKCENSLVILKYWNHSWRTVTTQQWIRCKCTCIHAYELCTEPCHLYRCFWGIDIGFRINTFIIISSTMRNYRKYCHLHSFSFMNTESKLISVLSIWNSIWILVFWNFGILNTELSCILCVWMWKMSGFRTPYDWL